MSDPTINDVHVLVLETRGDMKVLLSKMEDFSKWQEKHESQDNLKHEQLHTRISSMKTFGGAISIVSVIIGFIFGGKIK